MCKHNILAQNDHGYVIFCNGCGRYQVAFGTSLITFEPNDYDSFCNKLVKMKQEAGCRGSEKQKCLYVDIYITNSMMVLNHKELNDLNSLIDEAEFTRQISFLLEESHIKSQKN